MEDNRNARREDVGASSEGWKRVRTLESRKLRARAGAQLRLAQNNFGSPAFARHMAERARLLDKARRIERRES